MLFTLIKETLFVQNNYQKLSQSNVYLIIHPNEYILLIRPLSYPIFFCYFRNLRHTNETYMKIILAQTTDIPVIMQLFQKARKYMIANNNSSQWGDNYPTIDIIEEDINKQQTYLCTINNKIEGVFSLINKPDPTYTTITGRGWLNDNTYLTLHRIASSGNYKGMGEKLIEWSYQQLPNLRIDTHKDNKPMLHLLKKLNFIYCGTITVEDGTERLAFHKTNATD